MWMVMSITRPIERRDKARDLKSRDCRLRYRLPSSSRRKRYKPYASRVRVYPKYSSSHGFAPKKHFKLTQRLWLMGMGEIRESASITVRLVENVADSWFYYCTIDGFILRSLEFALTYMLALSQCFVTYSWCDARVYNIFTISLSSTFAVFCSATVPLRWLWLATLIILADAYSPLENTEKTVAVHHHSCHRRRKVSSSVQYGI